MMKTEENAKKEKKLNALWKKILKSVPGPSESELLELINIPVLRDKVASYILHRSYSIFTLTKVKECLPTLKEQVEKEIEYAISPKLGIDELFYCKEHYPFLAKQIDDILDSKSGNEFQAYLRNSNNLSGLTKVCDLLLARFPSLENMYLIQKHVKSYVVKDVLRDMVRTKEELFIFLKEPLLLSQNEEKIRNDIGGKLLSEFTLTNQEYATVMLYAPNYASTAAEFILKDQQAIHVLYFVIITLYTSIQTQFLLHLDAATKKELERLKLEYQESEILESSYSTRMDTRIKWDELIVAIGSEYEFIISEKLFRDNILGVLPDDEIKKYFSTYDHHLHEDRYYDLLRYIQKGFPGCQYAAEKVLSESSVSDYALKAIIENVPNLKEQAGIRMKESNRGDVITHEFLLHHFPEWKLTPLTKDLIAEIKLII